MAWKGTGTILLADDEPMVLNVTVRILQRLGFEVLVAENGQQAVELFQAQGSEIALTILDLSMPVLDGEGAFKAIRAINADAKVVISSGFSAEQASAHFEDRGLDGFLQKPYMVGTVRDTLQKLLS